MQALGCSSAAYLHAVTYARNRVQSALITNPKGGPVTIINHPDIKRTLLYMKSQVEGMSMLCLFLALHEDIMHASKDPEEVKKATAIVDILTPVVKAGISDASWLVTAEAMQVYGGYGYCQEYPVEQYARDTKVFSIYEEQPYPSSTRPDDAQDLMNEMAQKTTPQLMEDERHDCQGQGRC